MKPPIRNLLIAILAIGLIGAVAGIYMYTKESPDLAKVKADFMLPVSEIVNEFNLDEAAASAKYIDKIVEVTGPVSSIEEIGDSTMNITLANADQLSGVICTFKDLSDITSLQLKVGDNVTVRGVCAGMLLDVLLNDCVLVRQP
jgi:hypothetical protein